MDIGGNSSGIARRLSNFTARSFTFQTVKCESLEGILQAFKFDKKPIQIEVCKLVGLAAKRRGQKRNKNWKSCQTLWWDGIAYDREGPKYQELLDQLYMSVYEQDPRLKADLIQCKGVVFKHSIGRSNPKETVLTESEFCRRITMLRDLALKE